jgi:hypothetical protein
MVVMATFLVGQSSAQADGSFGPFVSLRTGYDLVSMDGSDNGQKVLTCSPSDGFRAYTNDSGVNWNVVSLPIVHGDFTCYRVSSSQDGTVMTISGEESYLSSIGGKIYVSRNSGVTWLALTVSGVDWKRLVATVTGDGTKIFYGDRIQPFKQRSVSWNGSSWTNDTELSGTELDGVTDIVTNADGSVINITMESGAVRYTRNGGSSWGTALASDGSSPTNYAEFIWLSNTAGSTSGYGYAVIRESSRQAADEIFRTSNSGATWTHVSGAEFTSIIIKGITSSSDGSRVLVSSTQALHLSTDFGVSWRTIDVSGRGQLNLNGAIFGPPTPEGKIFFDYNNSITTTTFSFARPTAPASIAAGGCSTTGKVIWDAATTTEGTISDYSIQYSSDGGNTWTSFAHTASTATSADITGLTLGGRYKFRVAAITQYGTGAYATTGSVTVGPSSVTHACNLLPSLTDQIYTSVTASSDSSKIVGSTKRTLDQNGSWYTGNFGITRSSNSGSTWSTSLAEEGYDIASGSADGACYLSGSTSYNYSPKISKNSGSTWTSTSAAGIPGGYVLGNSFAIGPNCSTGTSTYAVAWDSGVYLSINGGSTFTKKISGSFSGIAMSTTTSNVGDRMVAGLSNGKLMFTQNRGQTWSQSSGTGLPTGNWGSIVMSPDGSKVAATLTGNNQTDKVWISTNGGFSFSPVNPFGGTLNYSWVVSAARDGSNRLVAVASNSTRYAYSGDWGTTWQTYINDYPGSFRAITCNGDCSKLYMAGSDGIHELTVNARAMALSLAAAGAASGAAFTTQPQITFRNAFNELLTSENSAVVTASNGSGYTVNGTTTATASAGVAAFTNIGISASTGARQILYTSPGFDPLLQTINVTTGTANKLIRGTMLSPGANVISGQRLPFALTVSLTDDFGNVITSNSSMVITMTVGPGGTLSGETTAVLSNGVATFNSVALSGTPNTSYNIAFNGSGVTPFVTSLTPMIGSSMKLGVVRSSVGTTAGLAFSTRPQIAFQDVAGNMVTSETNTVYATISAGGTLVGTTTASAVNGIATFPSNFGISGTAGTTYTITYSAVSIDSVFETVTVTAGAANSIALSRSAVGTKSSSPFVTQPIIAIRDSAGNVATGDNSTVVTASISSGGLIVGTETATASNGLATFSSNFGVGGVAGTAYTLTYTVGSFPVVTQIITITPGVAKTAHLTRQSVGTASGSTFSTQPQVTLKDAQGNIVTNDSTTVVTASPGYGLFLGGTQSVAVTSGIATFTDLSLTGASGESFVISYSAIGTTVDTQTIVVSTGAAQGLQRVTRPDGATMGTPFVRQPVYRIVDNYGNLKSADNSTVVTAAINGCTGCMAGETATASNGVVTFSNLRIVGGNSGFILFSVSAPGLANSYTDSVLLSKGTPSLIGATEFETQYGATSVAITALTASTSGSFAYISSDPAILSISDGNFSANEIGTVNVTATFTPTNSNGYNTVTRVLTFIVKKASPSISTTTINKSFGDTPFTLDNASTSTPGAIVYTSNNPGVISVSGSTATVESAGSATITATFTPTDTSHYEVKTAIIQVTIAKANQAPLSITSTSGRYGLSLALSTSGGSSGGEVTYSRSGSCTLTGSALSVSAAGVSCSVIATMPGGTNYNDVVSAATTITFEKAIQTITVVKPSDRQMSATPFALSASSNYSGAVLSYSSNPSSVCTNSGETITMVSVGTCNLTVNANGNGNWETATAVTTSFDVTGKGDVIVAGIFNFSGNPGTTQNITFMASKNSANQDVPGTYTFTVEDPLIATINGSSQVVFGTKTGMTRVIALFTPDDTATYNTGIVSFLVTTSKRMQPALHFTSTSVAYGTTQTLSVTGGAGDGAVVYRVASGSCSVTGSILTGTGLGICLVNATKGEDATYFETSISGNITVTVKDSKVITPSFSIKYGETFPEVIPTIIGLVSPDSITGFTSIEYLGINGTIYSSSSTRPTAPGTYSITPVAPLYAQGTPGSYLLTVETGTLVISKADQRITFAEIGNMAYRASGITLNPTVNSSLSVTLTSSTTGVCSLTGLDLTINSLGTCTLIASQSGDDNHNPAVSVTRSFQITAKARPTLGLFGNVNSQYGVPRASFTAPSSDASGAFTYQSSNTAVVSLSTNETTTLTIVAPGVSVITATFTPSNTSLYEVVSDSMTVSISKANQAPLTVVSTTKTAGETLTVASSGGSGTGLLSYQVTSGTCSFNGAVLSSTVSQNCSVRVTKASDANYESVSGSAVIAFEKRAQTISFGSISNRAFSPTPFSIVLPSATSGSTPTLISMTQGVCTINGSQVSIVSQGLCTLKASLVETEVYLAAVDVYQNFTISGKASVVIATDHVVPTSIRRGANPVRITGGTASVPGSYLFQSLDTSTLTVSGDSITAFAPGAATIRATFTPTDSANYEVKTVLYPITVQKTLQAPLTLSLSRATINSEETSTVTTSGGSGTGLLAVVITSGPCVFQDSSTVRSYDYGICSIRAEVEEDANFDIAYSSVVTLNVVDPTVVVTPPTPPVSGGFFGGGGSYFLEQIETLTYSLSGTSITLKWGGNVTPVKIYVVAMDGSKKTIDVENEQFEATITGLIPGFAYTITVTPIGGQDASASKSISIALKPRQPVNVKVEPVSSSELKVNWEADPGIAKVKAILTAPSVETVTAISDGLALSLAAKPGVAYSLQLIAINSTDLSSEPLIIKGTFIPAVEVKPNPVVGSETATSSLVGVIRTSIYFAPKSLKLDSKERKALTVLKREVVRGRTVTCIALTSVKSPKPAEKAFALKQANIACESTVGKVKNVKVATKVQWAKGSRKASRSASSKSLMSRIDVVISKAVALPKASL